MKIRIATFNCENLFARYDFRRAESPATEGFTINELAFNFLEDEEKRITAQAIKATAADVIALQEVENLDVLGRFRNNLLGGYRAFPHVMCVDGNDPRFIDVALLSRYPITHVRSYQHLKSSARRFTFSRDCLEADVVLPDGGILTLYVNHFKSMIGGRAATRARRLEQVLATKKLIRARYGRFDTGKARFVVLGDFNDYFERGHAAESAIGQLIHWNQVDDVIGHLPPEQRWTHYFARADEYRQLDYILVSNALKDRVRKVDVVRKGMPRRATRATATRFPKVGDNRPKASDHCPLVVELDV